MTRGSLRKLRSELLSLPEAERAELAHDLVKSLDAPADAMSPMPGTGRFSAGSLRSIQVPQSSSTGTNSGAG